MGIPDVSVSSSSVFVDSRSVRAMGMAVTREALSAVDGQQKRSREEETRERIAQWIEEAQMAAGMDVEAHPSRHRRVPAKDGDEGPKHEPKGDETKNGVHRKRKRSWFACFKWWNKD